MNSGAVADWLSSDESRSSSSSTCQGFPHGSTRTSSTLVGYTDINYYGVGGWGKAMSGDLTQRETRKALRENDWCWWWWRQGPGLCLQKVSHDECQASCDTNSTVTVSVLFLRLWVMTQSSPLADWQWPGPFKLPSRLSAVMMVMVNEIRIRFSAAVWLGFGAGLFTWEWVSEDLCPESFSSIDDGFGHDRSCYDKVLGRQAAEGRMEPQCRSVPAALPERSIQPNELVAEIGTPTAIMKLCTSRRPDARLMDSRSSILGFCPR